MRMDQRCWETSLKEDDPQMKLWSSIFPDPIDLTNTTIEISSSKAISGVMEPEWGLVGVYRSEPLNARRDKAEWDYIADLCDHSVYAKRGRDFTIREIRRVCNPLLQEGFAKLTTFNCFQRPLLHGTKLANIDQVLSCETRKQFTPEKGLLRLQKY